MPSTTVGTNQTGLRQGNTAARFSVASGATWSRTQKMSPRHDSHSLHFSVSASLVLVLTCDPCAQSAAAPSNHSPLPVKTSRKRVSVFQDSWRNHGLIPELITVTKRMWYADLPIRAHSRPGIWSQSHPNHKAGNGRGYFPKEIWDTFVRIDGTWTSNHWCPLPS